MSVASGIPTFAEQPGIRDKLSRSFATEHPKEFEQTMRKMRETCENAQPNAAHFALAEANIPIITMNIDGLHQRAGSEHVLPIHGDFDGGVVLYGDTAPLYEEAAAWTERLRPGDFFLIVGTSFYTGIANVLRNRALFSGADIYIINDDAVQKVPEFLAKADTIPCSFGAFMERQIPAKPPYSF